MRPPAPVLETDRLILRTPEPEDFEPWTAFLADAEAQAFLGGAQPRPLAWRQICVMTGAWTVRGFSMFSVIEKSTGRWIGRLGPWQPEGWPGTEVGWGLVRDCWGKGYATEGAAAAIDWAFDVLGWDEVIHTIESPNVNSSKVAERLGSTILRQAVLPAPINLPVDVWGQSRAQWKARKR
ncbi:GNAT family N-acetyltransferase [Phenylobacterium sp. J367]|uniref:GNAT family N-acetyltransferase n=1 Tax=Phenylobacterium sp. J367 TaxID=2898435 RepID=UPI0021512936|nr:GNAT family N-acetyltransferase [Phenylobacterium sp. J367]MCR5878245.1 GNAT family N-acetyltransferase [Phenylobacterium sp. J367]